jgi:phosphatidylglycerophosphate synthase
VIESPAAVTSAAPGLAGLLGEAARRLRRNPRLRRSLCAWLATGLVAGEALSLAVAQLHGGGWAVAGLLTLGFWLVVALVMAGGAALLDRPDGTPVDVYGVPNGLSAIRAWMCPSLLFCTGWALPDRLSLILWIFIGGSVGMLDAVDGWVARRFGPVTRLGKAIDPATDALYFSVGAIGSVWLGIFTWWLMALVVVRYLGPLLLTPIVFLLRRRPELVRTEWGRYSTMLTGLVLFVCMLVKVAGGPVTLINAAVGLPLLVPTTVLHFRALLQRVAAAPRVTSGAGTPSPSPTGPETVARP